MASRADESVQLLSSLLAHMMWKDEIWNIGQFRNGSNINQHLSLVEGKMLQMQLDECKKCDFLRRTLHQDVMYELSSLSAYEANQNSYVWLVDTLTNLFGQKESPISSYVDLLKVQQLPGQSTREFLSSIRISAQKNIYNKSPSEKESMMVMAFINGLQNKAVSRILGELKPKTLEEAFNLVKKEKTNDDADGNLFLQIKNEKHDKNNHCQCVEKIEMLSAKVRELERIISLGNARQFRNMQQKPRTQVQCWNCNQTGHVARNCRRKTTCQNCGMIGHISENCRSKPKNIRRLIDQDSIASEPCSEIIMKEGDSTFEEAVESKPRCMSIQKSVTKQKPQRTLIDSWVQYIDGEGDKPRKKLYSETLISTSHSERARGKPVISGIIGSINKNMLLDTGSETNVIDFSLLKTLSNEDKTIKFYRKQGNLKCANGSDLLVLGYALVNVNIANRPLQVKFTVANNILPRIILGTKYMKTANMSVDIGSQCATMWNPYNQTKVHIPFLSLARNQENQEN